MRTIAFPQIRLEPFTVFAPLKPVSAAVVLIPHIERVFRDVFSRARRSRAFLVPNLFATIDVSHRFANAISARQFPPEVSALQPTPKPDKIDAKRAIAFIRAEILPKQRSNARETAPI